MSYADMAARRRPAVVLVRRRRGDPEADGRRDHRVRARRRLRAGAVLRPPGRRRQRQARPAGDPARHHPGRRRHPAPGAAGRPEQGEGHRLHRTVRRRRRGARHRPGRRGRRARRRVRRPRSGGPGSSSPAPAARARRGQGGHRRRPGRRPGERAASWRATCSPRCSRPRTRRPACGRSSRTGRERRRSVASNHDPGAEPARHRGRGRGGAVGPQARQRALPRLGGRHLRREVVDLLRRALHRLRRRPLPRGGRRRRTGRTSTPWNWAAAPASSC